MSNTNRVTRFANLAACLLLVPVLFAGCGSSDKPSPAPSGAPPAETEAAPANTHAHKAPRGGALVELGDHEANIEILADPTSGTVTGYVLDAHASNPVRIGQPSIHLMLTLPSGETSVTLQAVASFLTGEQPGDTSQFEAVVPEAVGVESFSGRITEIEARGKVFRDVPFRYPGGGQPH